MKKLILLGADWCPVTKETRQLFNKLIQEMPNFDYHYVNTDSEEGQELVKRFSVTDIPKVIFQDKIIFHGLPKKEELIRFIK